MREIRLYGSEGGGAGYSPYPYQEFGRGLPDSGFRRNEGPFLSRISASVHDLIGHK
jgi:hypothetical protein